METEVRATLVADASSFTAGMQKAERSLQNFENRTETTSHALTKLSGLIGTATVSLAFFGRRAFQAATDLDEMNITMNAVGQATGIGSERISEAARAIQAMGIEMAESRRIAVQFAQNQLDLSQAAGLARVAQDLAVVSQSNSTQTLQRLVRGVMTGNSIILRGAGITTQAGEAYKRYAQELGVSAGALNASQRQQAIINAIMEEGTRVAGAYEASMDNAGKVLRSFPRILTNLRIGFGNTLITGMNPLILGTYKLTQAFSEAVNITPKLNKETGLVEDKVGGLMNAMRALNTVFTAVLEPITNVISKFTEYVGALSMTEEQALRFANRFAELLPVISAGAVGFSALAAKTLLMLTPFKGLAGAIGPTTIAFFTLLATSAEVQAALGALFTAVQPLLPMLQQVAEMVINLALAFGTTLIPFVADLAIILLQALTPLINFLATSAAGEQIIRTLAIAFLVARTGLAQYIAAQAVSAFTTTVAFIKATVLAVTQVVAKTIALAKLTTVMRTSTIVLGVFTRGMNLLRVAIRRLLSATGIGLLIVGLSIFIEKMIEGWQTSQKFRDNVVDAINVVIGAVEKLANAIIRTLNFFLPKGAEIATVSFNRMARSVIKNAEDIEGAFQFDGLLDFLDRGSTPEDLDKIAEIEAMMNGIGDAAGGPSGAAEAVSRLGDQLKRIENVGYEFRRWAKDIVDLRDPMAKAVDEVAYQFEKFDKTMNDAKSSADDLVQGFSELASSVRNQLGQALSFARQELSKAKQEYDDFARSIRTSITGLLNFNTALQAGSGMIAAFENLRDSIGSTLSRMWEFRDLATAPPAREFTGFVRALGDALGVLGKRLEDSFLGRLRERRNQILEFGEAIRTLSEMGISEAALRQITSSGYDAGLTMARELIAGGLDAISEVNQLTDDVYALIGDLSTEVAEDFYTAGGKNGSEFINGLMEQAERAQEFAEKIRTLIEMGLSPEAIRQVLAAGLDAGSRIADELIAGGATVVDKVNTMLDAVERVATEVGDFGAQKFFQGGVDAAQALVDGIVETIAANEARIDSVLDAVAAKLASLAAAAASVAAAVSAVGSMTGVGSGGGTSGRIDDDLMLPNPRSTKNPAGDALARLREQAKRLSDSFVRVPDTAQRLQPMLIQEWNIPASAPRTTPVNFAAENFLRNRPPAGRLDDDLNLSSGTARRSPSVVINQTNNVSSNVDMNRVLTGLNWSIQQGLTR